MAYFFPIGTGLASWDSSKKQEWSVTEFKSASGKRKALVQQEYPSWSFTLKFPSLTDREVNELMAFYAQRKGSWEPFFYKDYRDYRVHGINLAKDEEGYYQAVIPYSNDEPCEYIDNVIVYVDGIPASEEDYTIDGGRILVNKEGTVRFDYDYYYKVVFESNITDNLIFDDVHKVSLKLLVVR